LSESVKEWTEPDGSVYRLRDDGNYDVIPPKKAVKAKPKPKAKKSSTKKGSE
tara:strand:- start:1834 stop:1989 length:156 start_codon:yes stop_codon:yes gene_type:complete